MLELQQNNCFFIFNFDHSKDNQTQFFDPYFWKKQQRIIGSAKGRGTTWFIQTKDLFSVNVALRHYYRGGLIGKLNRDWYHFSSLEMSRSFAEFSLLNQLFQAGLSVPKPIAARVEKNKLGFYRADILIEKIENAVDLTALLINNQLSLTSWQKIGATIRQLHNLQICHSDLNAHNILIQNYATQNEKIWLIDFDKCGKKSGDIWKEENLQRLKRSFLKEVKRMNIQFSEQNWQNLLEGYQQQ
ncbi:3-deoxy-D-manno-octulosonic acid kinase [Bisgaardia hudsonensis]|uniref:3-deoxy-D-manno-octulosonic acid kinase n=1 Tax=Bisgaardia hudsonensis TaxID=109472 RepID=A0A4R2MV32_9PAST|nr:3-deoxy-D-manno-octulosonic acid kinase [Bisgaardia hudsonensis]QLB13660.1 3-deoxy-D-manno-octulosonic acid kinase [Bisgaardia hudsonensis]TCP11993.1 3-deoxy-D-manno-octulosonic acid kinase [Bisgaardia hudsonensis]